MPTELPPRPFDSPRPISPSASIAVPGFLARVYGWMATGLLVTAGAALFTVSNETVLRAVFGNKLVFYGLLFARARARRLAVRPRREALVRRGLRRLPPLLRPERRDALGHLLRVHDRLDRLDVPRRGGHVRAR